MEPKSEYDCGGGPKPKPLRNYGAGKELGGQNMNHAHENSKTMMDMLKKQM